MMPTSNPDFWRMMDDLIARHRIVIDRPANSRHPEYPQIIYPLDYGYLEGTASADGEEMDIWLGSDEKAELNALFVTVDSEKNDTEIKLMVGCTDEEIDTVNHFFNDYPTMKGLLIRREVEK